LGERFALDAESGTIPVAVLKEGGRRLRVEGLKNGKVLARGESRPLALEGSVEARELLPFSSAAVAVALPAADALGTLTVDGTLAEWRASPSVVLGAGHVQSGPEPAALDLRAELYLAWDATRLAFALHITDDCPAFTVGQAAGRCPVATKVDRLAFGFDGTADGGDYGRDDLWVEVDPQKGVALIHGAQAQGKLEVTLGLIADGSGWTVEGSVPLEVLGRQTLVPGDKIGFDLVIVDEDPGQPQPTILRWSGRRAVGVDPSTPGQMGALGFGTP